MKTLLLSSDEWDLMVDSNGCWALASEPYALAQDAASAIKLFRNELYYNTNAGIRYKDNILGKSPPLAIVKTAFQKAAQTVPDVAQAMVTISELQRNLTGTVSIISKSGQTAAIGF